MTNYTGASQKLHTLGEAIYDATGWRFVKEAGWRAHGRLEHFAEQNARCVQRAQERRNINPQHDKDKRELCVQIEHVILIERINSRIPR